VRVSDDGLVAGMAAGDAIARNAAIDAVAAARGTATRSAL
jgi:hypothetical protein